MNDTRSRRMERVIDRSAQWLQSSHAYMPCGRDLRSCRQHRTESPVSMRSGNSGIPERDMLHTVLMVNTDDQMSMRAEEDTFLYVYIASMPHPYTYGEYPAAWTFAKNPITEEEARGYMNVCTTSLSRNDWVLEQRRHKGLHGATVSEIP
eukprot:3931309-Pyramimonas_sp.AAC.1